VAALPPWQRSHFPHPEMTSHRPTRSLLLLLVLLGPTLRAADTSLTPNGNFETDANADNWPDHWPRPKSGGTWEKDESGNHFLRLTSTTPGEAVLLYHTIPLPEGAAALEITWRQRVTDLVPGKQPWFDARIMMECKDAAGTKLKPTPPAPNTRKSTDGWQPRNVKFLLPEGARTLEFMPALFQVQKGLFDLDDINITTIDAAPLLEAKRIADAAKQAQQEKAAVSRRAKAAKDLAANGTLVSNGNFETDKNNDQWPDAWGRIATGSWQEENGSHFLRLTSPKPDVLVSLFRPIDIPADVKALELTWRWRITNLKPGKESWFDARLMMDFKDPGGTKLKPAPSPPYTRGNTKGWVEKSAKFLVPENALSLDFMPALFQVNSGTLELDDIVLKPTDPAPVLEAARLAEEERRLAHVDPEQPRREKWPQELRVQGHQVLNKDDQPVWLQGVNVVSLEFLVQGDHVLKSTLVAIDHWKSNCIRLPVKEEYWFGETGGQKDGGKAYRELVDQAITLAANRGAYVLLDLHRFGAPRQEHATFWKDAAAKYKDHPAVLFDLFNEAHGTSWEAWRDGGPVPNKDEPAKSYESIGMQALIDAVRSTGAKNIVLVGGLDWAYDLSGIAQGYEVNDRGGNGIIYSSHIYPWKRDWQNKVLCIADKHPILVGEVGADEGTGQEDPYTWVPDMLGFIQKHKLHWTAFSFHPKATPIVITDWHYTPSPHWGAFAKRALAGEKFDMKRMR
jgi:endoglucanase